MQTRTRFSRDLAIELKKAEAALKKAADDRSEEPRLSRPGAADRAREEGRQEGDGDRADDTRLSRPVTATRTPPLFGPLVTARAKCKRAVSAPSRTRRARYRLGERVSRSRRTRSKSTTGETAPPAAPARGAGGAGRGAARVPGPSSPALLPARALRDPLADKRVYRPRCFSFPAALRSAGAPLSPPGTRFARPSTERGALLNRRGRAVRASSAGCLKACHAACVASRACVHGPRGAASSVHGRGTRRARPGAARGARARARPPAARRRRAAANRGALPGGSRGAARAVPARGIEDAQEREPQMPRAEATHGA